MTNKAQAVIDFIKASKERTLLPCPHCGENPVQNAYWDYWCPNPLCDIHHIAFRTRERWNTRAINLDDLLDVVVKMGTAIRAADAVGIFRGHMGEMAQATMEQALALAQPYIDAVGER